MSRSTSPFSRAFSRRVMLKGAGCTMALPWLESVNALADTPGAGDFPKRFGVVFLGCGVNENHWSAEAQARGFDEAVNEQAQAQRRERAAQPIQLCIRVVIPALGHTP